MQYAAIGPIAIYLPETVENNDFLKAQYPRWDMDLIYAKTGIRARHVAAPGQCASDLGVAAAEKLFAEHQIDRSIDRFPAVLHANARLSAAHHRLPDARAAGAADLDRGAGFQLGLLGLRLRAGAGRRPDPQRRGPARAADYGGDLLEVHRPDRPLAADDLRRRGGGHADRGRRGAVAGLVRLRHRRPRRRHADRRPRRRPAPRGRHPAAKAETLAQQPLHGRPGTGQVHPRRGAADGGTGAWATPAGPPTTSTSTSCTRRPRSCSITCASA